VTEEGGVFSSGVGVVGVLGGGSGDGGAVPGVGDGAFPADDYTQRMPSNRVGSGRVDVGTAGGASLGRRGSLSGGSGRDSRCEGS